MILRLIIWDDYSIWYLFINYSTTLSMWWRRFDIDAVDESQISRSLVITIRRFFIWIVYFTSSIFSSLTDIDMSSIFFVDRLWLLEEMLSRRWKLSMTTFLITQRSNIIWTALNWDLLTLLTSIRTQNRIKRFVVDITYRWISLPAPELHGKNKNKNKNKNKFRIRQIDLVKWNNPHSHQSRPWKGLISYLYHLFEMERPVKYIKLELALAW